MQNSYFVNFLLKNYRFSYWHNQKNKVPECRSNPFYDKKALVVSNFHKCVFFFCCFYSFQQNWIPLWAMGQWWMMVMELHTTPNPTRSFSVYPRFTLANTLPLGVWPAPWRRVFLQCNIYSPLDHLKRNESP